MNIPFGIVSNPTRHVRQEAELRGRSVDFRTVDTRRWTADSLRTHLQPSYHAWPDPPVSSPSLHPAELPVAELLTQCEVKRLRRSGPGGQHRNKVETAVRLTHRPTGVTAMASERRSQSANLNRAVFRLRVNLALSSRSNRDKEPSPLWRQRCVNRRVVINPQHDDFPPLLAEVLDTLNAYAWDASQAADSLGCTISQLVKFLRQEPRALSLVNQRREELGLMVLH